ncbi:class I SAM-dependent methyltransferase [Pseudogulbenkiania sp. MAI-1]|uniref:class I SAM-dependent methyltransferase n=1 Tax=Pseudogulbenkiania sp. MAI-1 TaxID=990370 RepID=UPI0004A4BBB5|nr:class I SAM-dependent methyltransferase [Pseudogulbenkiania sp. MAI-1]
MNLSTRFVSMLRCPISGGEVRLDGPGLVNVDGSIVYRVSPSGIPLFAEEFCTEDARRQQAHFEKIAKKYIENLGYPHTQEYMSYLDGVFLDVVAHADLSCAAEICCGSGEAFRLLGEKVQTGIGVDISMSMLDAARSFLKDDRYCFIQGDATNLPLSDNLFSSVFIMGGIHHVNNREKLFGEVFRILKRGGRFYWREPVSDFFLWRWLRAVIYRFSASLDDKTERPLLFDETAPVLVKAGLVLKHWETCGFFGYCVLMNSDVLVFNRLFRYLPAIRYITRAMAKLDDWAVHLPWLKQSGLIVVGVAEKPE